MNLNSRNMREELGGVLRRAEGIPGSRNEEINALAREKNAEPRAESAKKYIPKMPIGTAEVLEAGRILQEYKAQKRAFDEHVVSDEDWWRLRHWDIINAKDGETQSERERGEIDPKSAWLVYNVMSKHADFMDAIPTFAALPREASDERAAKTLTQVLPVIFEQNEFEGVYHDATLAKCKHGTGIYGVFWDGTKYNGLGDILIEEVDCLRLFWEGGVDKLQNSANVFYVIEINREIATEEYPELADRLQSVSGIVEEYREDDYVDRTGKVEIVDWYYRRGGILHFCKFAAGVVLFSTENDPENFPHGIYKHGLYPFFVDSYYHIKGTPGGFGIIDIEKNEQEQVDRVTRSMLNNVLGSSRQKTFIGESAGVNAADVADPKKEIITFSGVLDDSNFRTVQSEPNAEMYMNVISQKVSQMKETSGNHDVSTGNAPAGITAASAIAALQEQAGKTSRTAIKGTYRVFVQIVKCVIELIREFYTTSRTFRITGEDGSDEFISFSNKDIGARTVERLDGGSFDAEPVFDVIVSAQKASPYSAMAQNELALEFYKAGMFEPSRADQALATLEMMDFRGKEKIIQRISRNGTLQQMVETLSQRLARAESALGISNAAGRGASGASSFQNSGLDMPKQNSEGVVSEESSVTKKARERSAQTAMPR